ncbi:hypothetical protein [Yinghuangia sp. YIM S09857]|uniref:hypothetical protein n=1 Tax=Yinghuangia sp. YIM S09857 TaxID=3436929 RepID=UPI003F53D9FB
MLLLGLLLLMATGAFTLLLISENRTGTPDYTVTMFDQDIGTMNSVQVFLAGIALALVFAFSVWMTTVGGVHARHRMAELRDARAQAKHASAEAREATARLNRTEAERDAMHTRLAENDEAAKEAAREARAEARQARAAEKAERKVERKAEAHKARSARKAAAGGTATEAKPSRTAEMRARFRHLIRH